MRFALSTAWNAGQRNSGTAVVQDILDAGFKKIELGFTFTEEKLKEVLSRVKEGLVEVVSVHNYCPVPDDLPFERATPDSHSLSDIDENERKKAVAFTKRSIETVRRLGARALVVHSGYVNISSRTPELIRLFRLDKRHSQEYKRIKETFEAERREKLKLHFDAVTTSYSELVPFAHKLGIRLGVENRYYYHEIPHPAESRELFRLFGNDVLGHWHDVGHAFILESLGFFRPGFVFHECQRFLVGMHYHDVIKLKDHRIPCTGEVDFLYFKPYLVLKKGIIEVIEAHPPAPSEEIYRGAQRLDKIIYGKT